MFNFGEIVTYSEEWFESNQGASEARKAKWRNTNIVVGGIDGELVTVIKQGTRYSQVYHESFLQTQPTVSKSSPIDATEAAKILGKCPRHIRRLARQGRLAGIRVGRSWVFENDKVLKYREGRKRG